MPVTAVVAKCGSVTGLLRLWGISLVTNPLGGWLVTGLVIVGFPQLRDTARESAAFSIGLGVAPKAVALALLGGFVITLMTHTQHSTGSEGIKLVPAIVMGFLLGAGYLDWVALLGLTIVGNLVGGLVLVTVLRLLQVPNKVIDEQT